MTTEGMPQVHPSNEIMIEMAAVEKPDDNPNNILKDGCYPGEL
jgi:hypothetical protein